MFYWRECKHTSNIDRLPNIQTANRDRIIGGIIIVSIIYLRIRAFNIMMTISHSFCDELKMLDIEMFSPLPKSPSESLKLTKVTKHSTPKVSNTVYDN